MKKTARDTDGFDGRLPDGQKLQVKSKKAGAHKDSATYVTLSQVTLKLADDLLIVFRCRMAPFDTLIRRTNRPLPPKKP